MSVVNASAPQDGKESDVILVSETFLKFLPSSKLYDGFCSPAVCTLSCLNGGVCTAPDTCYCPREYEGDRCERRT